MRPDGSIIFQYLATMKIRQIRLIILPNMKQAVKNLPKTCKLLPKWRNFAIYGHTEFNVILRSVTVPTLKVSRLQESIEDFRKSLRRLKKVPRQIEEVLALLKEGVKVSKLTFIYFKIAA